MDTVRRLRWTFLVRVSSIKRYRWRPLSICWCRIANNEWYRWGSYKIDNNWRIIVQYEVSLVTPHYIERVWEAIFFWNLCVFIWKIHTFSLSFPISFWWALCQATHRRTSFHVHHTFCLNFLKYFCKRRKKVSNSPICLRYGTTTYVRTYNLWS